MPSHPDPSTANRILLVVCAATFFGVLNASAVNVLLPEIGEEFGAGPSLLGWVMSLFLLVYGVAIPFYGRFAERYGARALFIGGLGLFAIGCLACALAPSMEWLLAARVVQGLGGAAFPGLGMALVSRAFPEASRGTALGFVAATMGVGAAVGPILGGIIADAISWRMLFATSAMAAFVIPAATALLPKEPATSKLPLDLPGGLLLATAVAAALFTVAQGGRAGWESATVITAAAVALGALGGLVMHQRHTASPFLHRELVTSRQYRQVVLMAFCSTGSYLAILVGLPLMLAQHHGLGPLQIGLVLAPQALATAVTGVIAGRVVDAIGPRIPTFIGAIGMVFVAVGMSTFGASSVPAITVLGVVLGTSYALLNTPIAAAIATIVEPRLLASALSLNAMVFFIGGSFGTTAFVTIVEARASSVAFNPLHASAAIGFSDAVLIFAFPMLLTAGLALGLASATQPTQNRSSL